MMAARQIPHRLLLQRLYSTRRKALKLWVKPTGGLSTQVSIKGCTDVDDFAQKVRQELNTNCLVSLFTSLDKDPIKPGLNLNDLLQTDEDFKNNTDESPLFVKLSRVTPPVVRKTIYIARTDRHLNLTRKFIRCHIKNDENLRVVCRGGRGLMQLCGPGNVMLDFHEIKDGEKYYVYMFEQGSQSWTKKEAEAMEENTLLSMKAHIMEKLNAFPVELPTDFYDSNGDQRAQEWDGVLFSENTLYLLEAKHSMLIEKIKQLADRVKAFPQTLERSAQKNFDVKFSRIVGIACGTYFPEVSRKEARRLGLMVVYPSWRHGLTNTNPRNI